MTHIEALKWIADVFEEPGDRITADTPRSDIQAWDSLGVLTLMADFDQTFGIILSDEEIQSMKGVNDILEILRTNGKLSE
jgi:acyl carrier protein